jgi:hypothetical protein
MLAAGEESTIIKRLERFRDAGATDLGVRIVPFGSNRDERIESRRRTEQFLSSLCPEL